MRRLVVACLLLGACGPGTHKAPTEVGAETAPADGSTSMPVQWGISDGVLTPASVPAADAIVPPTTTTTEPPTTTAEPSRPPVTAASRSRAAGTVQSTAYCLTGNMADGQPTHVGAVAADAWPLGTVLDVSDSPYGPGRFIVEDRIGWGSDLDFAIPGDCTAANQWGRRPVTAEVIE